VKLGPGFCSYLKPAGAAPDIRMMGLRKRWAAVAVAWFGFVGVIGIIPDDSPRDEVWFWLAIAAFMIWAGYWLATVWALALPLAVWAFGLVVFGLDYEYVGPSPHLALAITATAVLIGVGVRTARPQPTASFASESGESLEERRPGAGEVGGSVE
jgi:hypothetical protein